MGKEFLGRGLKFPIGVDGRGVLSASEYEEDVRDSVTIILSTAKGERVMRPDFGCGVHDFVFEAVSNSTLSLVEASVREALARWESRIELVAVKAAANDHRQEKAGAGNVPEGALSIDISISYRVRTTNNQFNIVYPFYLTEGR
jgi:phage baseplate assembly protein W